MEYADNGTLRDYLKNNFSNLTWKYKLDIAHQLASAILCLHSEGIVHRDLVILIYIIPFTNSYITLKILIKLLFYTNYNSIPKIY
jgi:serine/threonine protein kinase